MHIHSSHPRSRDRLSVLTSFVILYTYVDSDERHQFRYLRNITNSISPVLDQFGFSIDSVLRYLRMKDKPW